MLHTPLAIVSTLVATVVVVWALSRGRWPERVAALIVGLDWIGSILFQDRRPQHHDQPVILVFDLIQAAVLLGIVVRCRRMWVLWAAAFCVLIVLTHLVMTIDPRFGQWSYYTAVYIWSYGLLAALGAGVALEGARPVAPVVWRT